MEKKADPKKDETVDIATISTEKLKAAAYDIIAHREYLIGQLTGINQELAHRVQATPPVEDKIKK